MASGGDLLQRDKEMLEKTRADLIEAVRPIQNVIKNVDTVLNLLQHEAEAPARHEEELSKLRHQLENLKETSLPQLQKETETLRRRLDEQAEQTKMIFHFQFEPADVRQTLSKEFHDLYKAAHGIVAALCSKDTTKANSGRELKLMMYERMMSFQDMLQLLLKAAEETFVKMQEKLEKTVDEELHLKPSAKTLADPEIFPDIVQHIFTSSCKGSDCSRPPKNFQSEILVKTAMVKDSQTYKKFQTILRSEQKNLRLFVEKCCLFAWKWLLFRERGCVEWEEEVWYDAYRYVAINIMNGEDDETRRWNGKARQVWPLLVDSDHAVIFKGYVCKIKL